MSPDRLLATSLPVDQIVVGRRLRHDLGDLDGLAASMREVGLLHPVVVTPDGHLIAGWRRLQAAKQLGWATIPATVVDLDEILRGQLVENGCRKDLTPSEAVAIMRALEPIERAAAKKRQGARTDKHPEKFSRSSQGRALDKVAAYIGMHRTTLAKAEAIAIAAATEPDKYGRFKEDMDRTGRVNGVHRRLKVARQGELIRAEPPPLPGNGPYRVGVVDLPWPYLKRPDDPSNEGDCFYPVMSVEEMCAMGAEFQQHMHHDSAWWFWVTNFHMGNAYNKVIPAFGLEPKTILTWAKNKMGCGDYLRGQTEHCILATRGNPIVTLTNQSTLLHAPVRAHSQKPVEFYDLVESLCPAPRYADLFSRYQHCRFPPRFDPGFPLRTDPV